MPLGEIAGEALGGFVRIVGRIIFEVLFEFIIQGTGYILVRPFRPKAEPTDTACTVVGLLFWALVGVAGYFAYHATAT